MSLRRQVISRSDEEKEPEYIVKGKSKYVKEGETAPSFLKYIKSYILVPIILSLVLAIFRDGIVFIILMWALFLFKHIITYNEMYPPDRPATEEEIRQYDLLKKKEMLDLYNRYKSRPIYYDVYGEPKLTDREYSLYMEKKLKLRKKHGGSIDIYKSKKEEEMKIRADMLKQLNEIEKEYGSTWREDFRKELEENGYF